MEKECRKCLKKLYICSFSKNKAMKDGLQNVCRDCGVLYRKKLVEKATKVKVAGIPIFDIGPREVSFA